MPVTINFDEAIDVLVDALKERPPPTTMQNFALQTYGCDIVVSSVLAAQLQRRHGVVLNQLGSAEQIEFYLTFYDAAAELCRIGIIRPGPVFPIKSTSGQANNGDGFSLTNEGRQWVRDRSRFPRSASTFTEAIRPLSVHFGPGFVQRSDEAFRCYRSSNYLAACVMCGAAAESILLAIAVAKDGNDTAVIGRYRRTNGRKTITDEITHGLAGGLKDQLETFVRLLGVWRDEASHGVATTIDEPQANMSLLQLLRFGHFAHDHWSELTRI